MTDRTSYWITLAVGVTSGAAFGALLILLWRDRRRELAGTPMNVWNIMPHAPAAPGAMPVTLAPPMPDDLKSTRTQTYTLSATDPIRIVNAGSARFWIAHVRNIGPAGSIAFVATDANALGFPSMTTQIPAGGDAKIRIAPREALFARGSVTGVQMSIAAGEELA